jgi:hypothetical protein
MLLEKCVSFLFAAVRAERIEAKRELSVQNCPISGMFPVGMRGRLGAGGSRERNRPRARLRPHISTCRQRHDRSATRLAAPPSSLAPRGRAFTP